MYKSPGTDWNTAELIQAGGKSLHSEIQKLINYIWSKEELSEQLKESVLYCTVLYLRTKPAIKVTVVIIKEYHT
jgi:hypothetical protein